MPPGAPKARTPRRRDRQSSTQAYQVNAADLVRDADGGDRRAKGFAAVTVHLGLDENASELAMTVAFFVVLIGGAWAYDRFGPV
jgi:hypothetical protein